MCWPAHNPAGPSSVRHPEASEQLFTSSMCMESTSKAKKINNNVNNNKNMAIRIVKLSLILELLYAVNCLDFLLKSPFLFSLNFTAIDSFNADLGRGNYYKIHYFKHVGFSPLETEQEKTLTEYSLGSFIHYFIHIFIHSFNNNKIILGAMEVMLSKFRSCAQEAHISKGKKKNLITKTVRYP